MLVTVYTKNYCPKCEHLKISLEEIGVHYEVRPTEVNSNRWDMQAKGHQLLPVLRMIKDNNEFTEYTKGFTKKNLRAIMRKHGVEVK